MRMKYVLVLAIALAALISGCVGEKPPKQVTELPDESIISSVGADADTLVSDIEETAEISVDIEDDINIDELEISLD